MRTLILGDGLLGKQLIEKTGWNYISRKKDGFDAEHSWQYKYFESFNLHGYDQIINCIGFTDTYSNDKEKNWNINWKYVCELTDFCAYYDVKLVHISTDFVYGNNSINLDRKESTTPPVHAENWYSYTKLLGDAYVQLKGKNNLIIRTSFKPTPFPYPKAYANMIGNFDYVDIIADLIIELINKEATGVYNVGTEKKNIYQLAKRTNENVKGIFGKIHPSTPLNTSMNTNKMEKFLNAKD
jgi:dTDP-4-dehydrorhamnose reductase